MRRVLVVAAALALIPAFPAAHGSVACRDIDPPVQFAGSLTPEMLGADRVVDFATLPDDVGYYLVTARGNVYAFGQAPWYGSAPLVEGESVIDFVPYFRPACYGRTTVVGYVLVTDHGNVYALGDALWCGSVATEDLGRQRVVDFFPLDSGDSSGGVMISDDECGYRMLTDAGNVYSFGVAPWCGSLPEGAIGGQRAMVMQDIYSTSGCGYMVVTDHGNAYAFGWVRWHGSMTPAMLGSQRVIGIDPWVNDGYTMFTDRGNAYSFGKAPWPGSVGVEGEQIVEVEEGLAFGERGGVFVPGGAEFLGSPSGLLAPGERVVRAVTDWRGGYYLATDRGHVYAFTR